MSESQEVLLRNEDESMSGGHQSQPERAPREQCERQNYCRTVLGYNPKYKVKRPECISQSVNQTEE